MSDTIVGNLIRRVLKLVREEYRSCFAAKPWVEVASSEEAKPEYPICRDQVCCSVDNYCCLYIFGQLGFN